MEVIFIIATIIFLPFMAIYIEEYYHIKKCRKELEKIKDLNNKEYFDE